MGQLIYLGLILLLATGCVSEGTDSTSTPSCESADYQREFLQALNAARYTPRFCGDAYFISADPVQHSCTLEYAAEIHSLDRAFNDVIGHIGSDGLTVEGRVTDTGYPWVYVGEAMATTSGSPEDALAAMVADPRYCSVIMDESFQDAAVFRVFDDIEEERAFWTLVMAEQ